MKTKMADHTKICELRDPQTGLKNRLFDGTLYLVLQNVNIQIAISLRKGVIKSELVFAPESSLR